MTNVNKDDMIFTEVTMVISKQNEKQPMPQLQTAGLTSIRQLTDTTASDVFSFRDTTSGRDYTPTVLHFEEHEQEVEDE